MFRSIQEFFWQNRHSPLVNSNSVGIMSSCFLLVSPLSVSLVSSHLHCLCFSVSISNS